MAHISGSLVLMADYSWKDNSKISIGDIVLGADLLPATVVETSLSPLGNRRMMSLLENPYMQFFETDSLWARDESQEWWWVENATQLQLNWKSHSDNYGLKIIDSQLVNYDVEFATINGFEKRTIIDITDQFEFNSTTPFFKTDRFCPVIINGYVVASGVNEWIYDYTQFKWVDSYNQLILSNKLELIKRNLLK